MAEPVFQRPDATESQADHRFAVGDDVLLTSDREGIIRYIGTVHFADGKWYGVELTNGSCGKHDGTIGGTTYFQTNESKRGLFVQEKAIRRELRPSDFNSPRKLNRRESLRRRAKLNNVPHRRVASAVGSEEEFFGQSWEDDRTFDEAYNDSKEATEPQFHAHTTAPDGRRATMPDQSTPSFTPVNHESRLHAQSSVDPSYHPLAEEKQRPQSHSHSESRSRVMSDVAFKLSARVDHPEFTDDIKTTEPMSPTTKKRGGFVKGIASRLRGLTMGRKPSKGVEISGPTDVKLELRGYFDPHVGAYVGLPSEWLEVANKQFGVDPRLLDSIEFPEYPSPIPKILVLLQQKLYKDASYRVEGIFRLAPNQETNDQLKTAINRGHFRAYVKSHQVDCHCIANLIKVWFRELPDPILNAVPADSIEMAQTVDQVENVMVQFPEPQKSILLWLWDMCAQIAQYRAESKMTDKNLAIVIGPNMFNTNDFSNPMKAMTFSGKVVQFFQCGIEWRGRRQVRRISNFLPEMPRLTPTPSNEADIPEGNEDEM